MPLSSVPPDASEKLHALTAHAGRPHPLGATQTPLGANLAVYAREPVDVTLLLKSPDGTAERSIQLSADVHRSGLVWHVELRPLQAGLRYRWRVGRIDPRWRTNEAVDPWAVALDTPVGPSLFNDRSQRARNERPWAVLLPDADAAPGFDWDGVPKPRVPWRDTVIYEMHVRGFTRADDGAPDAAAGGSYRDVVRRIPYLRALGVTAVELLPVFEFNETEWAADSVSGHPLCNYWGYSTVAFFAPMQRFASAGGGAGSAVRQFQYMVRELHRAGIEVILDVVFNHTAELGAPKETDHCKFVGPRLYGMKQLAPHSYYLMQGADFANFSGCGNTVSCNNVATQDFIVDCVRYWAHQLGVDGFRFDLASILTRGTDGHPLERPPVVERLAKDASLRDVKLIAEPWDCGGLYQVGSFPHFGAWAEWNGKFRDAARRFVRGDAGAAGDFATRLCGSQDLYGGGRRPFHSINFVTAHDGFTLRDLVSFNDKHNDDNGEANRDGEAHNLSWNCGAEGASSDPGVRALRARQMRNLLVALLLAAGTPMLTMGDEYGHTRGGNNNTWCQDGTLNWVDWDAARAQSDGLLRFTAGVIRLRRECATLRRAEFLGDGDVTWHGVREKQPDWGSGYNLLAFALHGAGGDVYVAFNCGHEQRDVQLPGTAAGGWMRAVDTNLEPPRDLSPAGARRVLDCGSSYGVAAHSCIVLVQKDGAGGDGGAAGGDGGAAGGDDRLDEAFEQLAMADPASL